MNNLFRDIPTTLDKEIFEDLAASDSVRIERVLSQGQTSPEEGWYDQEEHEWVVVVKGRGTISYEDGSFITLQPGDYVNIPAHTKHRVSWTDPDEVTVWLAVFYK